MQAEIRAAKLQGNMQAPPAKAVAHRYLICASVADQPSEIVCPMSSADIEATVACLTALGAEISYEGGVFQVQPLDPQTPVYFSILPCGESGSTLRFILPLVAALCAESRFALADSLSQRPMKPLYRALAARGAVVSDLHTAYLTCSGRLQAGHFQLPGDISSQFISGLLLALPLVHGYSQLSITSPPQSLGYLRLTLDAIARFGVRMPKLGREMPVTGWQRYRSPGRLTVEGDWSAAAFWLVAAAISGSTLEISGLNPDSLQGDRAICDILQRMGVQLSWQGETLTASPGEPRATEIDAGNIPDLVPPLVALAALTSGETRIFNAARLRLKESDRLATITATLTALGADIAEQEDGLLIRGKAKLTGGRVSSCHDHRIAMMAAVAALGCENPVLIEDAQAINKSYPRFFADLAAVGGNVKLEER